MKPEAVDVRELNNFRMGSGGEGKPTTVIDNGRIFHYVGIGWVNEQEAKPVDYKKYPEVKR